MNIFKPWTWFSSEERKLKQEELKLKVEEKKLKLKVLHEKQIQNIFSQEKPYKNLKMVDTTIIVVLKDGTVLTKHNVGAEVFYDIKTSVTETEVINRMFPSEGKKEQLVESKEEREVVSQNLDVLEMWDEDFVVDGNKAYLKGVYLEMPASVAGSFIMLCEKMDMETDAEEIRNLLDQFESLKMFWYWTALNPIESSRNDLLAFVRNNDIKITKNGMLEMYRKVVKKGKRDATLTEFISNSYYKVKKNKKSPSKYRVMSSVENEQTVYHLESVDNQHPKGTILGNLETLYLELPNMLENRYTDSHTHSMDIRIGSVYKEDESKIDLDNTKNCSSGLHVGSHSFMFDGFGDTGVLALVNPCKVRSVPLSESNKMRVSEMYIAAVVPLTEYRDSLQQQDINDFSQEYFNTSVEELKEAAESKSFSVYTCQDNAPAISIKNIQEIKTILANKVVEQDIYAFAD